MVLVRRCVAWAVVVGVAMVARPALAADQIDNPRYKVWSNFKVGSSETLTGSMDMGGMQMQNEMKETLSELTPEQAVVEIVSTTNMMGRQHSSPPRKETLTAKVEKTEAKQVGHEKVEAMGKSFDCDVWEVEEEHPAGPSGRVVKGKVTIYASKEVPGGLVKMLMDMPDRQNPDQRIKMTYLLKSFEAK